MNEKSSSLSRKSEAAPDRSLIAIVSLPIIVAAYVDRPSTFHIGGTASRITEQSTLDAKHAGTVRFQGLQTVQAGRAAAQGNLVVMNRTGSLVVQDAKGRDRERYPIVYGARLKSAHTVCRSADL